MLCHGTSRYKKRPIRSPTVHHTSCGTSRASRNGPKPQEGPTTKASEI